MRAWRAADRYDPKRSSLRTWMFAIARNVTIDLARARSARPQRTGLEVAPAQDAKDTTEESLRSWEMEEALRHLGPHHRHAIVETYYRDRPCAEVAAEAGVPVGTMRSRLYYGLKAVQLTEMANRVWKRAAEYSLILAARRRLSAGALSTSR